MYINGDILISPFILNFFIKISYKLKNKRVYITADRHNIYIDDSSYIELDKHNDIYNNAKSYTKCGQDVFITTKRTFNNGQMIILNKIAIGRFGIDNIILGMAVKDKNIITIDISEVAQAVHIKPKNNINSYIIKKKDNSWNYNSIRKANRKVIGFACLDRIMCKYNTSSLLFVGKRKCSLLN